MILTWFIKYHWQIFWQLWLVFWLFGSKSKYISCNMFKSDMSCLLYHIDKVSSAQNGFLAVLIYNFIIFISSGISLWKVSWSLFVFKWCPSSAQWQKHATQNSLLDSLLHFYKLFHFHFKSYVLDVELDVSCVL